MSVPTFLSTDFNWKNGSGHASMRELTGLDFAPFPDSFNIKSKRTGEVRLFVNDRETMEDNDFFDGEAQAYISRGVKVQLWS